MPGFLLSKLKQAQPSMRRRLFLYMGALALLLLAVLFVALLLLGQLKSPRAETEKALTFQMGAFRSDMTSLWRNVSVMGVHLSEDMTDLIEEQTSDFSSLNGDVAAVGALQETMLEPLCQYARQTDCSGAFILLNVSLSSDPTVDSHAGLYVQRGNAEHTTGDLLLYRGMADIGRRHKVMPPYPEPRPAAGLPPPWRGVPLPSAGRTQPVSGHGREKAGIFHRTAGIFRRSGVHAAA